MDSKNNNSSKTIKVLFILLSIIIVIFSLPGNILKSNTGSVSLIYFESFYVYVIAIAISLYLIFTNKRNANTFIFISILTYLWTYYLVYQMIELITDVKMTIGMSFYIYLSSVIFLILALFFNDKKQPTKKTNTSNTKQNTNPNNEFNENSFIFTHFIKE